MVPNRHLENPQIPGLDMVQMSLDEPIPSSAPSILPNDILDKSLPKVGGEQNSLGNKNNTYLKMPSWREIGMTNVAEPDFNIGILIDDISIIDRHVSAMSKPASRCFLTSVVVLNPPLDCDDESQVKTAVREWLEINNLDVDADDLVIGQGIEGYQEMLKQIDIDAVYIVLSPSYQRDYILQALSCKKHVLVNDPISTLLPEYLETLECAKQNGKFIQSSTMFVHQYRVQRFMNRVLQDPNFGQITEVDASIQLNCDDVEKVGVKLPLRKQDGSIRVLGRFCVLVSTLFFNRLGSFAESARVNSFKIGKHGEIVSAECHVKFTKGRQLKFYVAYIHSATRQSIELKATSRYATMNDFVIEHPDGLATYRVYDRIAAADGKFNVTSGDSIDVAMGMGQERVLWRNFVRLSNELDKQGGWDDSEATSECRELTNVSIQTKKILIALMESFENDCKEVPIHDAIDNIQ
ncbi:oxidoreductase family, NAD-binding Rossmann fold domain containing protein [Nitzschia inconspicua]|uniref:Oxidoreductase family, NAD-binding Rossmann fold domain containing protein n=1 Tax=Nitzschia inconspicua TaxID=303405 RepID=A0A9K3LL19_9STRA|nr:oxidoreductase family, NAD-binding Rossmann fold domain containing protein [Nitzschia inconspicua]